MIFGAPLTVFPFPLALSAVKRCFFQSTKLSARALAVSGLRIDILSLNSKLAPGGVNIDFHSDPSGKGGRADKGVSFESEEEVEYGQRVGAT
jgi:hypothetical protein